MPCVPGPPPLDTSAHPCCPAMHVCRGQPGTAPCRRAPWVGSLPCSPFQGTPRSTPPGSPTTVWFPGACRPDSGWTLRPDAGEKQRNPESHLPRVLQSPGVTPGPGPEQGQKVTVKGGLDCVGPGMTWSTLEAPGLGLRSGACEMLPGCWVLPDLLPGAPQLTAGCSPTDFWVLPDCWVLLDRLPDALD